MKYLETSYKDINEKKQLEEKGLFCYDLRDSDMGNSIATIEKSVLVNRAGSLITNEKIPLGNTYSDNFIDYETFIANNELVNTIEELLSSQKQRITRKLNDNMYVVDVGYRNEIPVVLVEKTTKYGKEYIIGFNYKIKENSIEWGYGYYYDNNKNKAIKDFKRVLNGENLADTFNEKKKKNKDRNL